MPGIFETPGVLIPKKYAPGIFPVDNPKNYIKLTAILFFSAKARRASERRRSFCLLLCIFITLFRFFGFI